MHGRVLVKKLAMDLGIAHYIPLYFITIDTPHLGIKNWIKGLLGDFILDETDKDLMLLSADKKGPMLARMIDNKHLEPLNRFKHLIVFAGLGPDTLFKAESTAIRNSRLDMNKTTAIPCYDSFLVEGEFGSSTIDSTESKSSRETQMFIALDQLEWKRIYVNNSVMHTVEFWTSIQALELTNYLTYLLHESDIQTQFEQPKPENIHLAILIHGLEGLNTDFQYISNRIKARFQGQVKCISPECNHSKTMDGILNGATRIFNIIKQEVDNGGVSHISLVGHSLGGIYARCVAGLLLKADIIPKLVMPMNFITLATPHLGSREHSKILGSKFTAMLAGTVVGQTGKGLIINRIDVE